MKKTPTNSANITGLQNEDVFATLTKILKRKGYITVPKKRIVAKEPPIFSSGDEVELDFYFEGKPVAPKGMAISAKYQESGGSVDSKVFYEMHVIKKCTPCPSYLLVRGEHWLSKARARARAWLSNEVDGKQLRGVFFTVDDLYKWASSLPDCTGVDSFKNPQRVLSLPLPEMEQTELF